MASSGFHSRSLAHGGPSWFPRGRKSPRISNIFTSLWSRRPRDFRTWKKFLLRLGLGAAGVFVLWILLLWFTLPDLSDPRSLLASQSTVIVDRNGIELYRLFGEEDRTYVESEQIPEHAKQALVAIEDERFFDRGCIDIRAILRAGFANIFRFKSQGGSTITQQLARNALLTREKRFSRKIREIMLACELERQLTKDELLELYANWIPFGQNAYGIEQASKVYFGASVATLSLAQSAVLAALPQRPSYFTPYGPHLHTAVSPALKQKVLRGDVTKSSQINDDDITIGLLGAMVGTGSTTLYVGGRTDQVLSDMEEQGFITEKQRLAAQEELEHMTFQPLRENIRAPHFVLWVKDQVESMFSGTAEEGLLEQGGLIIKTTLDWKLQEAAETVVAFHHEDIASRHGAQNVALVALDPQTKEILAYVGNADYSDEEHGGKIDMARAPRQPGSSFKPFVYATTFQKGYGPATPLYDVPTTIGDDEPQNFDGRFWGLLTVRQALGASRNVPAVKAFFLAGGENAILSLASAMGVRTPGERRQQLAKEREGGFDYGWPLALGAAETPLVEMVHGYSTFASGGNFRPIVGIRTIVDEQGNILYEAPDSPPEQVLDPRIAYQITSILSDVSVRPNEYWKAQLSVLNFQTAAKTGTSNKCLEWLPSGSCKLRKPDNGWTIGYTPELVAGVWIGNADSSSLYDKGDGLNSASPFWKDFMERAHRILPVTQTAFSSPPGIIQPQVSLLSGELPAPCTPVNLRKAEIFLEEHPPRRADPACAQLTVDRVTGLLASDECPADAREEGNFLVATSVLSDRWPQWQEGVDAWVQKQMEIWKATPTHSGSLLPLPVAPTEVCDTSLTPGRLIKPTLTILAPKDGGPAAFPAFQPQIEYKVGSTVREVMYLIDGRLKQTAIEPPFEPRIRIPRTIKSEGMHTLEVTLVDEYFNTVKQNTTFTFAVDHSSPTIRVTAPLAGATIPRGSDLVIRAEADDPDGGLKYVQFYLDGTLLTTKPREPFTITYPVNSEPGNYTVRVVAVDDGGNEAEDEVSITVEE